MFKAVTTLLLSNLLTLSASALPLLGHLPIKNESPDQDPLFHKSSIYSIAPMNVANWVYLGYAPRMMDPTRVSITVARASYTIRVTLEMTEQEVADYPKYLIDRAEKIDSILTNRNLRIAQPSLLNRYQQKIAKVRASHNGTYASGLAYLKEFFPQNIFELKETKSNGVKVIAHFVYPATMVRPGGETAPERVHYVYSFEERKTLHKAGTYTNPETGEVTTRWDHIFGGFPALWFFASENGIGIHGPIRYSEKHERSRAGEPIPQFWQKNDSVLSDYDRLADITPNRRWDLVRKQDSAGCVRSESMEIRHLLPAKLNDIKRVPIRMTYKWDEVEIDGVKMPINVDYYVMDPYLPQLTKQQWLQQMAPQMLSQVDKMLNFPYLDPQSIEFFNKNGWADNDSMTLLNEAPY